MARKSRKSGRKRSNSWLRFLKSKRSKANAILDHRHGENPGRQGQYTQIVSDLYNGKKPHRSSGGRRRKSRESHKRKRSHRSGRKSRGSHKRKHSRKSRVSPKRSHHSHKHLRKSRASHKHKRSHRSRKSAKSRETEGHSGKFSGKRYAKYGHMSPTAYKRERQIKNRKAPARIDNRLSSTGKWYKVKLSPMWKKLSSGKVVLKDKEEAIARLRPRRRRSRKSCRRGTR